MRFVKILFGYFRSIFSWVQLVAIVGLLLFAFVLTDTNLFARIKYDLKIGKLNSQIEYYRNKTAKDRDQLEQLNSNKDDIEKFARETYQMRKSNEDIFIVE